jgi:hypothetical protein
VPPDRIIVVPDPAAALERAASLSTPEEEIAVLPTYTAMLALRSVAERAGAVPAFWAAPVAVGGRS